MAAVMLGVSLMASGADAPITAPDAIASRIQSLLTTDMRVATGWV